MRSIKAHKKWLQGSIRRFHIKSAINSASSTISRGVIDFVSMFYVKISDSDPYQKLKARTFFFINKKIFN